MQMDIRRSADRGHADHGWLNTRHTFSFANYYDRRFMGFSHLRVINEDQVTGGAGFPSHPHRNMEIISYVVEGALEHRDTLGTGSVIRPGEVQVMSAGRGVAHSEFNHDPDAPVHFLQIWVLPREANAEPRYEQRAFPTAEPGLTLVVSPDGREDSLTIGQDMDLHRLLLEPQQTAELALRRARSWVQVVRGTLEVNHTLLNAGDGLAITDASTLHFTAHEPAEALVFDLL